MLARRLIPCLDVANGVVVKGVRFRDHRIVGNIVELEHRYADEGSFGNAQLHGPGTSGW